MIITVNKIKIFLALLAGSKVSVFLVLGSFFEKLATIFARKNDFEIISNDQLQRPNLNEETRFLLDETS